MDDRSVELFLGDPGRSQITLVVNDVTDLAGNCVHPGSRVSLGYNLTVVPISATTLWRYQTNKTAPPAGWCEAEFDDTGWLTGAPLFASTRSFTFSPLDPIRTQLGLSSDIPTLYFRHSFVFRGDPTKVSLTMRHMIDDGAVFHLNATQVFNVAVGSTEHGSLALRSVGDAVYEGPVTLPTTSLRVGTNIVAVQVHQVATTSTDVVMGMEWTLQAPSEVLPPDGTIPPARIRIEPSAAGAVLWWDGCGRILQEAASLSGAEWVDVPGASSPHPLPGPAGRARFFRLVDRR